MDCETGPLRRLAPTTNGGEIEPGLRSLRGSLGDRERDLFDEDPIPETPLLRMSGSDSSFKFVRHSNSEVTVFWRIFETNNTFRNAKLHFRVDF